MLAHAASRRRRFKIQRTEIEGRPIYESAGKIFLGLWRRTSRPRRLPVVLVGRSVDARKRRLKLAAMLTTIPESESERSSSTFRDFFSLGAGVAPAQGVEPTGSTFNN